MVITEEIKKTLPIITEEEIEENGCTFEELIDEVIKRVDEELKKDFDEEGNLLPGRKIVIDENGDFKVVLDETIDGNDDSIPIDKALKQCKEMVEKYSLSHKEDAN